MTDEKKLQSLRPYLQYHPDQVELCDTLEKALVVVRAAKPIMRMIDEGILVRSTDYDVDPGWHMKALTLVLELKSFQDALAPFGEGEGKA